MADLIFFQIISSANELEDDKKTFLFKKHKWISENLS